MLRALRVGQHLLHRRQLGLVNQFGLGHGQISGR
jgi:hypothetical protein